jgi:signal recognition particle receptor subunit beta
LEELTSFEKYVSIYDFVSDYHDKVYPTELIPLIQDMWQEEESQKMFKKLQDAEIPLSMRMYFSDIHRILESNYVPTNQDILHLRISTNSVTETIFQIDGNAFHFYDVSGLKHRRRQWTQYFMDVTTILFIVSLAGYDQVMAEDEKTNRLTDSIVLFGQIVNNPILSKPDVIVFFNKQDLYDEKIKQSNLHDYFPEYVGKKGSKSQGYQFIKEKFLSQSQDEKRLILTHTTCCTDAGVMSKIIYSVMYSHFLNVVLALFKKIYQMLD